VLHLPGVPSGVLGVPIRFFLTQGFIHHYTYGNTESEICMYHARFIISLSLRTLGFKTKLNLLIRFHLIRLLISFGGILRRGQQMRREELEPTLLLLDEQIITKRTEIHKKSMLVRGF